MSLSRTKRSGVAYASTLASAERPTLRSPGSAVGTRRGRVRRRPVVRLAGMVALVLILAACGADHRPAGGPPFSPEESLRMFEAEPGFRVELFAAEPLIADPVDMEIDENGRVYVVELIDYPEKDERLGTVKLLEDTTGDGLPDRSVVFADGLWMPKGVMRWKDGILVADAEDVIYFEDTTGDGRADVRRVVLTGFEYTNPQGGINVPRYGLDNWIYVGHRVSTSVVHFPDAPDAMLDGLRGNLRFRPDTYEIEALSASTQFGHTFDAWGRHLLTSNANHIYHEVVQAKYARRNPDLLLPSVTEQIPAHGTNAEIFAISPDPGHQLFTDVGVITSACGITSYLGGAFPPDYQGMTVVAEPQHNLVHADLLEEDGATFIARRLREGQEFLASRDGWFRPVNFYVGPDGALYVVDYYRDIIEQPRFLSDEVMALETLYDGSDRGRIWRVVPEEGLPLDWMRDLDLGQATVDELVPLLASENAWYRRTAQRLLVDRADEAAVPLLEGLARESDAAEGRLHALWTLEGMGRLTPELVRAASRDPVPGVRESAIRLSEEFLEDSPALVAELTSMRENGRTAFQLLLTLGEVNTPAARQARLRLLMDHVEDEWMHVAALTASDVDPAELFDAAVRQLSHEETEARRALFRRVGAFVGARGRPAEIRPLLARSTTGDPASAWWRGASLEGLGDGLRGRDEARAALAPEIARLADSFFGQEPALRGATLRVLGALGAGMPQRPGAEGSEMVSLPVLERASAQAVDRAAGVAVDRTADPELRADAVRLIALLDAPGRVETLQGLLGAQEPISVQLAAVQALRRVEGLEVAEHLLSRWAGLTPQVRSDAVEVLLQTPDRMRLLIDAMEQGIVQTSVFGWERSKRLMLHSEEDIRVRSRALLSPEEAATEEIVARYAAALRTEGDPSRGELVFVRECSMCHAIGGEGGVDFGPDLAGVRTRRPEFLLGDILMPNREITAGYEHWIITLTSGEQISGVISDETPTALTVRTMGDPERLIARADVESIEAVPVSLMPEGMAERISVEEMTDLIAFLRRGP